MYIYMYIYVHIHIAIHASLKGLGAQPTNLRIFENCQGLFEFIW